MEQKGIRRVLMPGNHAIGAGAIEAGCDCYFGYPITPQNELTAYMSEHMLRQGRVFVQSESEVAAVNMVLGTAMAGGRAMTSSSSPGISLKQEGLSFLAGMELPSVVVNVNRGGPGLGNIAPSQGDYFQSTRGGGHGDYRHICLAPASVQECYDLTMDAFDLADYYRNPVLVLADGMLGQMMEPILLKKAPGMDLPPKDWALTGARGRKSRCQFSLILDVNLEEEHNWKLVRKYERMTEREIRFESIMVDDAQMVLVAFGTVSRIARAALKRVRDKGLKVGMLRPITLWPFPATPIQWLAETQAKLFMVLEMNTGQMVEDVKLAVGSRAAVDFYGRAGGRVPTPEEFAKVIEKKYHRMKEYAK